jgi:hypothetical protein
MKAGRRKVLRVLRRISREESRDKGLDAKLIVYVDGTNILKKFVRGKVNSKKNVQYESR